MQPGIRPHQARGGLAESVFFFSIVSPFEFGFLVTAAFCLLSWRHLVFVNVFCGKNLNLEQVCHHKKSCKPSYHFFSSQIGQFSPQKHQFPFQFPLCAGSSIHCSKSHQVYGGVLVFMSLSSCPCV